MAPPDEEAAGTVVRWYAGHDVPRHPTAGRHGPVSGSTVSLPPRTAGNPVAVAVFTYDAAGNVSAPAVARLP